MITSITRASGHRGVASAARVARTSPRLARVAPNEELDSAARDRAYRRLVAVVLGLDVATLASELQSARKAGVRLPSAA